MHQRFDCGDHRHPRLKRAVPKHRVEDEFSELYRKAGGQRYDLDWPERLGKTHDRNTRRYAQVALRTRPPTFEFAPQTVWLDKPHRRGLMAHEIGHWLDPTGGEDDADKAAHDVLGIDVVYDHRWPGKGLQMAINPRRMSNACRECGVRLPADELYLVAWPELSGPYCGSCLPDLPDATLADARSEGWWERRNPRTKKKRRKKKQEEELHLRELRIDPTVRKPKGSKVRKMRKKGKRKTPKLWYALFEQGSVWGKRRKTGRRSVRISVFDFDTEIPMGSIRFTKDYNRNEAQVYEVFVDPRSRRKYIATVLYELASQEAWKDKMCLVSDTQLTKVGEKFWKKQVKLGKADPPGKRRRRYQLCEPPPKSLLNPPVTPWWVENPTKAEKIMKGRACLSREEATEVVKSMERSLRSLKRHKTVSGRQERGILKLLEAASKAKRPEDRIRWLSDAHHMLQPLYAYGGTLTRKPKKMRDEDEKDPRLGHFLFGKTPVKAAANPNGGRYGQREEYWPWRRRPREKRGFPAGHDYVIQELKAEALGGDPRAVEMLWGWAHRLEGTPTGSELREWLQAFGR